MPFSKCKYEFFYKFTKKFKQNALYRLQNARNPLKKWGEQGWRSHAKNLITGKEEIEWKDILQQLH